MHGASTFAVEGALVKGFIFTAQVGHAMNSVVKQTLDVLSALVSGPIRFHYAMMKTLLSPNLRLVVYTMSRLDAAQ